MLDRFDARESGAAHSFRRTGVDGYGYTRALCGLDSKFHLFQRKGRMRTGVRSPAVIAIQLDPVRAASDLVSDNFHQTIDSIRFFGALRNMPLEHKAFRP